MWQLGSVIHRCRPPTTGSYRILITIGTSWKVHVHVVRLLLESARGFSWKVHVDKVR